MNDEKENLHRLFDTYGLKLLRYATSILLNKQDAEDIVQEVFVTAYKKSHLFDGQNEQAWLYKITYNKCINHKKRLSLLTWEKSEALDQVEAVMPDEISETMQKALQGLKDKERMVLYMRVVEGYNYEDLTQITGESVATLRKRYERTKQKIKKLLEQQAHDPKTHMVI